MVAGDRKNKDVRRISGGWAVSGFMYMLRSGDEGTGRDVLKTEIAKLWLQNSKPRNRFIARLTC